MTTHINLSRLTWSSLAIGLGLALVQVACSSDDNESNDPNLPPVIGGAGKGGTGAGGTGQGGSGPGQGGTSNNGGTNAGGSGGGSGGDTQACTQPPGQHGCSNCPPTDNLGFLNHCTTGYCSPFNNAERLPRYNNGNLPPLP